MLFPYYHLFYFFFGIFYDCLTFLLESFGSLANCVDMTCNFMLFYKWR